MFAEFINQYGTAIMYAVLTFIGGFIGIALKNLFSEFIKDKTKEKVAEKVVKAVEQIYQDLHGDDKLNKALDAAAEILASKGITVTGLELRMLVEAAVKEMNEAFHGAAAPAAITE